MKVAYFGCDLFMQCLHVLRSRNHEIVAIFAAGGTSHHADLGVYAREHSIPFFTSKPDRQQIDTLEQDGVNCLLSVEYDNLIPLPSARVMTINVHPTLLPQGRGPTPLSHLILQYPQHAGVTFHKLSEKYDTGDIILQSPLQIDEDEGLESLLVKLNDLIPQLLNRLLADLPALYEQARPQSEGSYWPKLTDQDRLLNWHHSVGHINRLIRAFGRFGVIACIGNEVWLVSHVETYTSAHASNPGTLLNDDAATCAIAVTDGIVIIFKNSIIERRII